VHGFKNAESSFILFFSRDFLCSAPSAHYQFLPPSASRRDYHSALTIMEAVLPLAEESEGVCLDPGVSLFFFYASFFFFIWIHGR